jgi:hypothetical protein
VLHALLHNKLTPLSADPDRFEDATTSTVIGSLVFHEAWDLLAAALDLPELRDGPRHAWFWPRLDGAQPDVVLQLGDVLVVVEAKVRSDKHNTVGKEDAVGTKEAKDQLVREWASVSADAHLTNYPAGLPAAIEGCARQIVYLVDGWRARRAEGDVRESQNLAPDAVIRLVTWQKFHAVLRRTTALWACAVRQFLERQGLASFGGDWTPLLGPEPRIDWRVTPRRPEFDFLAAVHDLAREQDRSPLARALARISSSREQPRPWWAWCPSVDQIRLVESLRSLSLVSGESNDNGRE